MSATAQRKFSLSKGDADEKIEPDHLLVLVHGILARYMICLASFNILRNLAWFYVFLYYRFFSLAWDIDVCN